MAESKTVDQEDLVFLKDHICKTFACMDDLKRKKEHGKGQHAAGQDHEPDIKPVF